MRITLFTDAISDSSDQLEHILFVKRRPVHPGAGTGAGAERGCNPDNDRHPLTVDRSG
jgi:hypothetical protein